MQRSVHAEPVALQARIRKSRRLPKKEVDRASVSLGRLIAEEREHQGLSQHDLAKKADCPDDMIGHLEAGRRSYWVKLRDIVEALAPNAKKLWLKQCTDILWGRLDEMAWKDRDDQIGRLLFLEWLRSSGDRATATSTETQHSYLPGSGVQLKEPEHTAQRVA